MNKLEHELWESIYSINRCISLLGEQDRGELNQEYQNLLSARDQVWMIGVRMFDWKD